MALTRGLVTFFLVASLLSSVPEVLKWQSLEGVFVKLINCALNYFKESAE